MSHQHRVRSRREANELIARIAGLLPIYYGAGEPIPYPHVVATTMDALSGEGVGYHVMVYPQGAHDYSIYCSVYIGR